MVRHRICPFYQTIFEFTIFYWKFTTFSIKIPPFYLLFSASVPYLSTVCVSSLSLFGDIYLPSQTHGVTFAPWLRFARLRRRGRGFPTLPERVPSLTGTYLQSHECMVRALQPLCMIIENPRDTSQPHSHVIYCYFVSITSENRKESFCWRVSMSYTDWYVRTETQILHNLALRPSVWWFRDASNQPFINHRNI